MGSNRPPALLRGGGRRNLLRAHYSTSGSAWLWGKHHPQKGGGLPALWESSPNHPDSSIFRRSGRSVFWDLLERSLFLSFSNQISLSFFPALMNSAKEALSQQLNLDTWNSELRGSAGPTTATLAISYRTGQAVSGSVVRYGDVL